MIGEEYFQTNRASLEEKLLSNYNGKKIGIAIIMMMNITICKGIPALIKSKNLSPPAVITNALVGDATGVANAMLDETAIAKEIDFACCT